MKGAPNDLVEAGECPPDTLGLQVLLNILPDNRGSVVDPNTGTLNLDPDPKFWPNLDPDPSL